MLTSSLQELTEAPSQKGTDKILHRIFGIPMPFTIARSASTEEKVKPFTKNMRHAKASRRTSGHAADGLHLTEIFLMLLDDYQLSTLALLIGQIKSAESIFAP